MWTCGALLLLVVGTYSDQKVTVGDITTHVKGQSGKIAVYKGSNETDGVTITFNAIQEISKIDGDIITNHSYNNFAQLSFTFSTPENSTYPDSNVTVTQFSFMSTIVVDDNATATLTSYVYIFTSDGNITVDGSDVMVKSGNMKFNVKIENWPFCDTCRHGNSDLIGEFLDFSIEIKGKKQPKSTNSITEAIFDLGGGASVSIPKQVIYDNTTTKDMPDMYPKLVTRGSKTVFIFRFEKFNSSVLYDPTVVLDTDEGDGGDDITEGEVIASGISAKVRGQSGKITVSTESAGDDSKNSITVEFDNLAEMKSDGNAIADSKSRFNNFANQLFTFGDVVDVQYPGTNIAAQRITFLTNLTNYAVLKIEMYAFKDEGDITQGDEITEVKSGSIKFNIDITSWPFCSSTHACQHDETGEYLDIDIVIKGSGGAALKKASKAGEGAMYDLGTSGSVTLSKKIKVNGAADFVDMESGYPELILQGNKQIFRFRFPKFTDSVSYDPTIFLFSAATATVSTLGVAVVCLLLQVLY